MTDPVDELLSEAGRRWRAAQPDPPEPDVHRWAGAPSSRRWLPMVAAAAATTVIAGAGFLLVDPPGRVGPAPAVDASAAARAAAAAALVVDDGEEAQASGGVVAKPGEPVRFCGPMQNLAGNEYGGPGCDHAIEVTGVNLGALTGATERGGVRFGYAQLRGVWRAGVLAVTRQSPMPFGTPSAGASDRPLPCSPPSGGWRTRDPLAASADDIGSLRAYVRDVHPEQFREPWVSHPSGFTDVDGTPAPTNGVKVLVVEVVRGDVGEARRELESRYTGDLCVVSRPGLPSLADQAKVEATVGRRVVDLMGDRGNGVFSSYQDELTVRPQMLVLTRQLYDKLAAIGFANVQPDPWLRPVP